MGNFNVEPTCFENVNKSFCIDVFLTNSSKCLENSLTLGRGLPDLHKTIATVMKTRYERSLRIVKHRDRKNFDTKIFKNKLQLILKSTPYFEELQEIFMDLLNNFAAFKVKESQYKQCGVTFPPGKIY